MGLNSNNFVVIQGWMSSELQLKGNDLLIYALIYGFSQDGESLFQGSRKYIAETFNISLPTVDKALTNLKNKGLIQCYTDGKTYWHYRASTSKVALQGGVKKLYRGCKETLHSNIDNTKNNKILSKDNITKPQQQFNFGKTKPKKENLYSKCIAVINDFTKDPELQKLLTSWFNMLLEKYRDKGKSLYVNVFKGKLNMLKKYSETEWLDIVEYNLQRGYEGFYPIPNFSQPQHKNTMKNLEGLESSDVMTADDYKQLKQIVEERAKNGLRTAF